MASEKSIATALRRANRKNGRSWRKISREDYAGRVKPGTLHRIAKTKGEYFPSDPALREALGAPLKECATCHRKITVPRVIIKRTPHIRKHGWMLDVSARRLRFMLDNREPLR